MLPRRFRLALTSPAPFTGQRTLLPDFTIIVKPNNLSVGRVGFIVSKKVSPKSTQRNHLKRQLAQAFVNSTLITTSNDYLIIAKPSALKLAYEQILTQLSDLSQNKSR